MPKNHPELTAERLREVLSYDPETGIFRRKVATAQCIKVGAIAGSPHSKGYLRIMVDNRSYLAHRLVWLYVYGRWPADQLDHINGVRSENRIANLREATSAENNQNRAISSNNTSRHQGIYWNSFAGKWHAQIMLAGRMHHIGLFKKIEDAVSARRSAKAALHTFNPSDRITQQEPSQ